MTPVEAFMILGLSESCTWQEVHARFKEESFAWHPDRYESGSRRQAIAHDKLKRLIAARDCLRVHFSGTKRPGHEESVERVYPTSCSVEPTPLQLWIRILAGGLCGASIGLGLGWLFQSQLQMGLLAGLLCGMVVAAKSPVGSMAKEGD